MAPATIHPYPLCMCAAPGEPACHPPYPRNPPPLTSPLFDRLTPSYPPPRPRARRAGAGAAPARAAGRAAGRRHPEPLWAGGRRRPAALLLSHRAREGIQTHKHVWAPRKLKAALSTLGGHE
jgi:hypothetical protein